VTIRSIWNGLGSDLTWLFATGVCAALFFKLEIPQVVLAGPAISTFAFCEFFQEDVNRVDR
jgi:hypothetical protein